MTELHEKLTLALAELAVFSPALAEKFGSSDGETPETLQAQLNSVEATINAEQEARAALARRRAVFEGLAALGYEVGAELDTAWVRDGRIVLRKPAQPGYGVEIGGGANSERLQMRVVAFGDEAADTARDRDAETLWCGDVANLQSRLAVSGANLTIERALPVGAQPLKRLSLSETRHRREAPARQAKGLG